MLKQGEIEEPARPPAIYWFHRWEKTRSEIWGQKLVLPSFQQQRRSLWKLLTPEGQVRETSQTWNLKNVTSLLYQPQDEREMRTIYGSVNLCPLSSYGTTREGWSMIAPTDITIGSCSWRSPKVCSLPLVRQLKADFQFFSKSPNLQHIQHGVGWCTKE